MSNEQARLDEINQRVTRIESRIVHLGDSLGTNLRSRDRQVVLMNDDDGAWVEVDAQDISYSVIRTSLRQKGVEKGTTLSVRCKGETIGSVRAG